MTGPGGSMTGPGRAMTGPGEAMARPGEVAGALEAPNKLMKICKLNLSPHRPAGAGSHYLAALSKQIFNCLYFIVCCSLLWLRFVHLLSLSH